MSISNPAIFTETLQYFMNQTWFLVLLNILSFLCLFSCIQCKKINIGSSIYKKKEKLYSDQDDIIMEEKSVKMKIIN